VRRQKVATLLYGADTPAGRRLTGSLGGHHAAPWVGQVEDSRPTCSTASTPASPRPAAPSPKPAADPVVLRREPRTLSLVPPIHFALLDAATIHPTFDALVSENWAAGLPTNALLISGPSKTADIQQTLAYGAHGPKELVVLVINAEGEAMSTPPRPPASPSPSCRPRPRRACMS
jgi:L-lactate dehydrogenase complex protein LldG